jgi:hypothetical protein
MGELFKASLQIKPGHEGTSFDIDYFGQDDGADTEPDAAFRLIFQLGSGLMIYLYVVGFSQPGKLTYFHTFWIKDCAAAYVEMEELGAPESVEGIFSVPVVYKRVALLDTNGGEKEFVIDTCRFEATKSPLQSLQMVWNLYSLKDGKLAMLSWNNKEGWSFERKGKRNILESGERVLFRSPK